jgi:hypothetical protein
MRRGPWTWIFRRPCPDHTGRGAGYLFASEHYRGAVTKTFLKHNPFPSHHLPHPPFQAPTYPHANAIPPKPSASTAAPSRISTLHPPP